MRYEARPYFSEPEPEIEVDWTERMGMVIGCGLALGMVYCLAAIIASTVAIDKCHRLGYPGGDIDGMKLWAPVCIGERQPLPTPEKRTPLSEAKQQ